MVTRLPGRRVGGVLAAALVLALSGTYDAPGSAQPPRSTDATRSVIAQYRERIPRLMQQEGVPGLAVALVDADRTLWVAGFGHLDGPDSPRVNADTIFSTESMSKLFTATAVMQAVARGRLDLDAPITTYLPHFTVHSAFERHPERKITLRMLLSHTAGFAQEAPVGNNDALDPGSFDAHVRSISDTWLRFPVGSGYAYSNLGIDLAGYILERVEGKPFPQVMRDSLLGPLGMDHSTFDRTAIASVHNRAVGHASPYPAPPLDVPMTAAGGLYSSAADLARLISFELNDGSLDGRVVLGPRWMKELRTVPAPHAGAPSGYALGVMRHRWNRWAPAPDLFEHGGGGYGNLSDLWWLPQLGLGVAILTNADGHDLQEELALSMLADLLTEPTVYRERLLQLPSRAPAEDPPDWLFEPPPDLAALVARAAIDPTKDRADRWAGYAGSYGTPVWGYLDTNPPADRFVVQDGVPYFEARDFESEGRLVRHQLSEIEPGLFLADNGETLDLRGSVPTWRNLRLVRLSGGPAPWQWAVLGGIGAVAVIWLVAATVRGARRRRSASGGPPPREGPWPRAAAIVSTLTATLALATIGLLAAAPGLVDSGFLGWLEFPVAVRLALHVPLGLAVLVGCLVGLVVAGWTGRWWSRVTLLQYSALAAAATALVVQLAVWRLIGFGFS